MAGPSGSDSAGPVRELASGVDALYLSGRADLPVGLFTVLEDRKAEAVEAGAAVPWELGGVEWLVQPRRFGLYRYCLEHPYGQVGVTVSERLPSLRVQVRAEYLHGVGPGEALRFFEGVGELLAGGPVVWSLSRLDLFCDVQGWSLAGDDRHRFVCRASKLDLHEDNEAFNGFGFGRRTSGTVTARIYDKTIESDAKGSDWWADVWGERFDSALSVLRVEFELGRKGLTQFGIDTPTEGLDKIGVLWASLCDDWLRFTIPTGDATKSRWPTAPEWEAVARASLRSNAVGMRRIRAGRRHGTLRNLTWGLVGYTASVGAVLDLPDLGSSLAAVRHLIEADEQRRGVAFTDRIAERRNKEILR